MKGTLERINNANIPATLHCILKSLRMGDAISGVGDEANLIYAGCVEYLFDYAEANPKRSSP